MTDVIIRRRGESQKSTTLGDVPVNILTSTESLESMTMEMPPESEIPKLYSHKGEEIRIVLEGEIEIELSEKSYPLKEGDVIWHKSSMPHKIKKSLEQKGGLFFGEYTAVNRVVAVSF